MDASIVSLITGSVDFSSILIGVGAIGAGTTSALVAIRGAWFLLGQLHEAYQFKSFGQYWEEEDIEEHFGSKRWYMR